MKRSTDRILTTHTGSLPRPRDLIEQLQARDSGQPVDTVAFESRVRESVAEIVRHQAAAGVDIVNDGEQSKIGYSTYVKERLSGFDGEETAPVVMGESADFPNWGTGLQSRLAGYTRPVCNGPIAWKDKSGLFQDLENLKSASLDVDVEEVFMTAASPGVVASFMGDQYYGTEEKYMAALAEAMKEEYEAINQAGFLLQLDCPDLAGGRHSRSASLSNEAFLKIVEMHLEVLNYAVSEISPDRMRLHLCWGNYEGPHHLDIPLKEIIGLVLAARPGAVSFEGANPRHEHEWAVFKDVKLPDGKIIIPGVLDSTTNYIEHPELVAQRIVRYAGVVGRENVIAGSDCGFSTFARTKPTIDPDITWAKLQAMAEGAEIASKELWS